MRVLDIINSDHVTVSCELFPPKLGKPLRDTERIVSEIAALHPSFISVTCGAGGSTGDHTVEIARCVQKDNGVTALAHVTCVSTPRAQIRRTLTLLQEAGVENILALRGDLPADGSPACADFAHASDLIEEINRFGGFCVGGACYPEGHPESPSTQADLDGICKKVDSGCAFLTTQMFFDNNILYNFLFRIITNDNRNFLQTCQLCCTPSSLTSNNFIIIFAVLYQNRLQQTELLNRICQLLQSILIKIFTRLFSVRLYLCDLHKGLRFFSLCCLCL